MGNKVGGPSFLHPSIHTPSLGRVQMEELPPCRVAQCTTVCGSLHHKTCLNQHPQTVISLSCSCRLLWITFADHFDRMSSMILPIIKVKVKIRDAGQETKYVLVNLQVQIVPKRKHRPDIFSTTSHGCQVNFECVKTPNCFCCMLKCCFSVNYQK